MSRRSETWHSGRVGRQVSVRRWGEFGTPVLFFPTAAGDCEEGERFHMIQALDPLLQEGRIKLYSVDSIPGTVWLTETHAARAGAAIQLAYDAFVREELVPFIRDDCQSPQIEIVTAGPSIGAYEALAAICRHPDIFRAAICMSGTYDLSRFLEGQRDENWLQISPLDFLPQLDENGPHLRALRERFVLLAHGTGRWEDPNQSWRVAQALGRRGIPNRVDEWGSEWDHDWPAWRRMLPQYLSDLLRERD